MNEVNPRMRKRVFRLPKPEPDQMLAWVVVPIGVFAAWCMVLTIDPRELFDKLIKAVMP